MLQMSKILKNVICIVEYFMPALMFDKCVIVVGGLMLCVGRSTAASSAI